MNNVTVIDLSPSKIIIESPKDGQIYVYRRDIASIANGLLMALNGEPEAAGVVMLARALGCEIKQVTK